MVYFKENRIGDQMRIGVHSKPHYLRADTAFCAASSKSTALKKR